MLPELTKDQLERLNDAIGESSWCSDNDCSCHRRANLAVTILDGDENYGAFEDYEG